MKINFPLSRNGDNKLPMQKKLSGFLQNAWIMLLLPAMVITGCKKITEEPGITGVCPIVVSTIPTNGATAVSLNSAVTATFNEVMDPATINSSTFILRQGSVQVAGLVTYSGMTAVFTPAVNFAPNTVYTGTITTGARDPQRNALQENYVWSFTTGVAPDTIPPRVISTDPFDGETNVVISKIISATFSKVMNPATINTTTFTLRQGTTPITGTVTYTGSTASFTPASSLAFNTTYTATITTGATDMAGNALVSNYVWSFTTAPAPPDGTRPTVISTDPAPGATAVPLNKIISATFSEVMNPATINNTTFLLRQGATPVPGTVTYSGTTALFIPSLNLLPSTVYTATITTGAQDPAGNGLLANYVWSFTTAATPPPPPPPPGPTPPLGSIALFGSFGGSAGITNQGLLTRINNGSIGTTGVSTLITGFTDLTTGDVYTVTPLNNGLVSGRIHTAPPPPGSAASLVIATQALADANTLYNNLSPANRPLATVQNAELGGLTLPPGVYRSASGPFMITNGNLTLDGQGNPNAEWIFQAASSLTVGVAGPTGAKSITLINSAQSRNVYWYVGSAATINGAGGGTMAGTIVSSAGMTFSTAGNAAITVLNGRAISLNASVTMVNTVINVP